ncbi:PREDICTED: myotubularin-related protein 9 [Aptenodytes forsteri]|uniref:myotubularin-related protein 9 n=1 Tax=Aptenodytes forsteri TaxID=9233 RepID=UPI000905D404|nr:PREDICTED: myotubularin-related protein 9 [Aptenodytes forsteri]
MEFSELIKTATVERVLLSCAGLPAVKGTLCITSHHLLLSSCPGGDAQPGAVELWLLIRNVDAVEKRVQNLGWYQPPRTNGSPRDIRLAGSSGTITLRCKDLKVLQLEIPGMEECLNIASSIEALSSVDSVMMMYPFFYRPQSLKLEEGWHLFPLEQYFQQIASQTSQWRLSDVNRDFTTCPTYPPAVIVPAAVDDDTLRKAARFRQGGRFPVLSYYHPKNGTAGHPFHLRCARSAYSHARLKQEAPLFLLFLDCVWQLSRQFPFSLEFGERLLLTLFDNAYASAYGTFLCNNVKERCLCKVKESTHSLWAWLNQPGEKKKYLNPLYSHNALVIWPSVEPQSIQLWQGLFFRWIRSSQYLDEAWAEIQQLVEGNDSPVKESTGNRLSRSLSDPAARTENER